MTLVYPTEPVRLSAADDLRLDIAGAESNFAIALSRLGHLVRFISRTGADPFGERMREVLSGEGIELDSFITDPIAPTGLFFREWLEDGRRYVYYYRKGSAASHLVPEDLDPEWFVGAKILHLTGITPALSQSCLETCQKAIELARQAKMLISFDPNYRAPLWDHATARKTLIPLARSADFLLLGHEDALALFGEADENQILERSIQLGVQVVVLKRAERGSLVRTKDQLLEIPAYPARAVVDPVGAGDGFDAGFIAGWLRGWPLTECADLASKVGALAVETRGDYQGYPKGL